MKQRMATYDGLAKLPPRTCFWLPDDYLSGDVKLEVWCRPRGVGPHARFAAIFHYAPSKPEMRKVPRSTDCKISEICGGGHEMEVSMFIDTVEIMDEPQCMVSELRSTLVRLQFPERFLELVGQIRAEPSKGKFADLRVQDVVAGLGVRLVNKGVAATVQAPLDGLVDGLNVALRPNELQCPLTEMGA